MQVLGDFSWIPLPHKTFSFEKGDSNMRVCHLFCFVLRGVTIPNETIKTVILVFGGYNLRTCSGLGMSAYMPKDGSRITTYPVFDSES
jgi:hypothetical protein